MVTSQESSNSPKLGAGRSWMVLGMGLAVGVYALALRRFGLELADEGVLLAQMDRVVHGQVPYRDFHVGYGPALFWLHAASFAAFGPSVATVRTGLAMVHGLRAAALTRLGRAVGGTPWAIGLAGAFIGIFLPVAPGICAPGNIPYPAWFTDALGLGALLLLTRQAPPYVAIGALWGVVFAFKQNGGVFGLAAAMLTVVLTGARADEGSRAPGLVLAAALVGGAVAVLRDYLDATLAVVFVVPLLPLAAATARARMPVATISAGMRLLAGFAVVAGGVLAVSVASAGWAAVRTDFLQIGTDTIRVYHVPHPSIAGTLAAVREVGGLRALRLLSDASWFALFPLLHVLAGVLIVTGRIESPRAIAVVTAACLGYLQLYPRMDFWHLLPLAPLSLVTLAIVATAVGPGTARVALAILVVVAVGRFLPTVPVIAATTGADASGSPVPRIDVRWDLLTEERLRRLPEVVSALRGRGRVAGFPALGVVNFALGTPSPWRHDYFFPGRPPADEERALAAEIERDPPEVVIVLDAPGASFEPSFAAHPLLVETFERRFVEERRIGPYRLLVPRPPA